MIYLLYLLRAMEENSTNVIDHAIWAIIGSLLTLIGKYLVDKNKNETKVKLAELEHAGLDKRTKELILQLEISTSRIIELEKNEKELEGLLLKYKLDLHTYKVKFGTLTDLMIDLNKDKPEIVRLIEKLKARNAE